MSGKLPLVALVLLAFGLAAPSRADTPGPSADEVKAAAVKSIALLEKSRAEYLRHRECFSCHHQAVPTLALTLARAHGFEVDEESLEKQLRHTANHLKRNRDNYQKGVGQGGQVDTAGYALWTLEAGGCKPDAVTSAVAEYLLLRDKDQGPWRTVSRRPPSEVSHFTTTYLAVRGLQSFASEQQRERATARTEAALRWLLKTRAVDTEDRAFRLWGLKYAGAEEKDIDAAAKELLRTQRADGGWAQAEVMESDAYGTGSALVALHQAGGLPTSDPAYRRGLAFLVKEHREDGSWYVKSRSRPFQLYFESGFPHGKDQFISITASAWATAALALACEPAPSGKK